MQRNIKNIYTIICEEERFLKIVFLRFYFKVDILGLIQRDSSISLKTGVYCKVVGCKAVVLDLHRHLTVEHHLATSDLTYINCSTDTTSVHRQVFF